MLDENLSWKSHIEIVGNKISKVTGILYRLKNVFPANVFFVLYNSLIVSYMNYGLLLWGIHSHKLELLQKKALGLMTNSNYLAHTTPLLIKHGLLIPIRSGLFQTVNDPGGGGFKSPPPPRYDLENYCVNLHHIIHVNFTRCFWHVPIGIFQKFANLPILQRFQNKK